MSLSVKPFSVLVLSLSLLCGAALAVLAFQATAPPDPVTGPLTSPAGSSPAGPGVASAGRATRRQHPRRVVRWAPCPAGTTLVQKACVTDVVKTVRLPAVPARAVRSAVRAAAPAQSYGPGRGDDEGGRDRDDGERRGGERDD